MGALNKQATIIRQAHDRLWSAPTIYERVYPYKPTRVYYFSVSMKFLSYPPRVYMINPTAIAIRTRMMMVFLFSLILTILLYQFCTYNKSE